MMKSFSLRRKKSTVVKEQKGKENPACDTTDYGYEDHLPISTKDNDIYGYGDDDGSPQSYDCTRVPQRSSMKGSNPGRRASIGACCRIHVDVFVPGGGRQRVQRRRSVDFNTKDHVEEIPRVPFDAAGEVWLQPDDFACMKMERNMLIRKMKNGDIDPWEDEETRGLEKYVDSATRRTSIDRALTVVLSEQDVQEMSGDYNDERIAKVYKRSNVGSPEKAAAQGRYDACEIQDYLRSPRTVKLMMRRMSC